MPAWLTYTLLRIGVFAAVFAILLVLGISWFWAALVAAVIALCLSFILLRRQRDAVARQWAERRPNRTSDDEAEDAAIEHRDH